VKIALILIFCLLLLVIVTVCAGLVVPTVTLPKASIAGATSSEGFFANAGAAPAVSINNNENVRPMSGRVNEVERM
jgi:hypothetical protein